MDSTQCRSKAELRGATGACSYRTKRKRGQSCTVGHMAHDDATRVCDRSVTPRVSFEAVRAERRARTVEK
jgi:hypothetical protein